MLQWSAARFLCIVLCFWRHTTFFHLDCVPGKKTELVVSGLFGHACRTMAKIEFCPENCVPVQNLARADSFGFELWRKVALTDVH